MGSVQVLEHPVVHHFLAQLRNRQTDAVGFRSAVRQLSVLLAAEATRDLKSSPCDVETPLAVASCRRLAERIALAPILRAGLGMVDALLELLPEAQVRHLGFYRDERTLHPVEYYKNLPPNQPADVALVLDPMLATGGSAIAALEALAQWGVPRIKLLALIAAPEGIANVTKMFPQTQLYVCHIDAGLNQVGYIVPGLGDAGDRIFGSTS